MMTTIEDGNARRRDAEAMMTIGMDADDDVMTMTTNGRADGDRDRAMMISMTTGQDESDRRLDVVMTNTTITAG